MSHRRISAPQFAHLQVAKAESDRFYKGLYGQDNLPEAVLLTKAEFAEQFLKGAHETYSLDKLAQFRSFLLKADPATGEEEFQKACADLKPFVVVGDDKQVIKYVREKKKPSLELSKAGEGSKGGKVIGHTRSGKPVYANKSAHEYSDFSKEDHEDARRHHFDMMREHDSKSERIMNSKVDAAKWEKVNKHAAASSHHDKVRLSHNREVEKG